MTDLDQVLRGLDSARRAGWAKFYESEKSTCLLLEVLVSWLLDLGNTHAVCHIRSLLTDPFWLDQVDVYPPEWVAARDKVAAHLDARFGDEWRCSGVATGCGHGVLNLCGLSTDEVARRATARLTP